MTGPQPPASPPAGGAARVRRRAVLLACAVAVVLVVLGAVLLTRGPTGPGAGAAPTTDTTVPSGAPRSVTAGGPPVVVGVSDDRRTLVDQHGDPVLLHAETAWAMMQSLTPDQIDAHLEHRAEQGFNGVLITPLPWIGKEGEDRRTPDGLEPFDGDASRLDPDYWRRLDQVLETARRVGITVFLAPGAAEPGFEAAGLDYDADKAHELGEAMGARYARTPGIVWLMGVDYRPEEWDAYDPQLLGFVDGLRDGGATQPVTVQYYNGDSTSWDNPRWRGVYDLEAAYTYRPAYGPVRTAYDRHTAPVMLIESNFEEENNEGGPETTDESLRRQVLWTYTSGGIGAAYGHRAIWPFLPDWQEHVDTRAVAQLGRLHELVASLAWWRLVPDDALIVQGAGEEVTTGTQNGGFADVLESDHATAAISPDGDLALVYVPTARTVVLDTTRFARGAQARWVDPASGRSTRVPLTTRMTTPGPNAEGDGDWLLVVEAG
ncbi:DUF4038 domain-containing protein [Isoptericola sp. NPDC057191]|uniref:apiosidase-like domain-containing protein n=1 Tax=Isoptericola sp. NPDC057191 TaxID=3346041 RepID=UPI003637FDFB